MKKEFFRTSLILNTLFLFIVFSTNLFAQTSLFLDQPINSEIVDGKPTSFAVSLSKNQTAKIVAEQTGADVSLTSYNPSGEKLLEWGLPLGRVGSEEILVIAESAGEYRIEVTPGNSHRNYGEFIIKLTEIRETVESDQVTNQTAIEIMRLMPEALRLARLDTNSERRTAVELWNEILNLAKLKKDKVAETRALHAIGSTLYDLGEFQQSLDILVQVVENWRKLKIRRYEMVAIDRIADVWFDVGEYEKAIAAYIEIKNISLEINSRIDQAISLTNIGNSYLQQNQPEKAIGYYSQSLPVYIEMKVPVFEAEVLNFIGRAYFALNKYETATEYFQKALELAKKKNFRDDIARNLFDLGKTSKASGNFAAAYDYLTKANSLAREIDAQKLTVQVSYHLAIVESESGELDTAISHLEDGLKITEKIRGELRNKQLRTSYFSTVQNIYELYTDLLIERSRKNNNAADAALALEMSESSRSRSLVELLQEASVEFRQNVDAKLIEKEKDLNDEINAKYLSRERLLNRSTKQEKINEINTEINNLQIELDKLNLQIRRENPRYANLTNSTPLSAKEIQNLLDDETVLLEYKLGGKRSFLWLVTHDSINVFELPKREEIESNARRFYDLTVSDKKEDENERQLLSAKLSDVLLSKVKTKTTGKRLVVVAEGILQYLPFSALQNDKNYLTDTNEIVILPSATVLAQLRENQNIAKQTDKTIAIFADPVFDGQDSRISKKQNSEPDIQNIALTKNLRDFKFGETLPRLLASREEARNISQFVDDKNASVRLGFDAKLGNIENADLSGYRILHFATHGLLNTSRPELSGLVFSLYDENGRTQDGFLSLNDVYNLDISSDLVVLSACQTALGKDVRGEGLIGISRGFLYAGSQRIVASLWKVDDSATAEFMKLFYKNHLEKKMSASAALRQAKIEMKKIPRYKSPYYWSAFTLLGEWK